MQDNELKYQELLNDVGDNPIKAVLELTMFLHKRVTDLEEKCKDI